MAGPRVRLAPATPEVTWAHGTPLVQRAGTEVRVAAGFERQDGDALSVLVAVENQGAQPFEVDPRSIAITPCQSPEISSCLPVRWARDPEQLIESLDAEGVQAAIDATNAQTVWAVMTIFGAVGNVASIAKGGRTTGGGTRIGSGAHHLATHQQVVAQTLEARRQDYAATCLRRTTVAPGQSVAGRVLLPFELSARYVWLHLGVGGQKFTIPFHQTITHPPPWRTAKRSLADRPDRERRPADWGASAGFLH